jgi:hypothetical protein
MRGYGVLAILAVVWNVVEYMYGPIGGTRLAGTLFLLSAIWMIRAPSIAISLGRHEVGSVSGWQKAFVLVPAAAIGLALLVYAPEITCWPSRYRHLCS